MPSRIFTPTSTFTSIMESFTSNQRLIVIVMKLKNTFPDIPDRIYRIYSFVIMDLS